jgi:hypothetical protein
MKKYTKMEMKFEKEMVCWLSNYETNINSKCTNFMKKHSTRNKVKSIRDDTIGHQIGNGYNDNDDDDGDDDDNDNDDDDDDDNNNNNNNNNNVVLQ